jgi:hypothetical protein
MTEQRAPQNRVAWGWWRRARAPLMVVAVALPALAFVVIGLPIIDDVNEKTVFVPVAQGDTVTAGGYSFTLTVSQEFPGEGTGPQGNQIPVGSALVGAILEVRPLDDAPPPSDDDPLYCDLELTSRANGLAREWSQVSQPRDFGYGIGDDRTTTCSLEREPIDVEAVFVTPEGAYDEATLDMTIGSDAFRFELAR